MKIVVLTGGLSPERDVSLSSGSLIANSLIKSGHSVLLLDVYEGIDAKEPFDNLFSTTPDYTYKIEEAEPDLEKVRAKNNYQKSLIGKNVIEICQSADVVFLALHGAMGENGQLQATLDNYGIKKYTGTGYIGSLLAMDKNLSKILMKSAGVLTADWIMYNISSNDLESIENAIGYPCVVKPCSCGSSVGVSIVNNPLELADALNYAKKYEDKILIEKKITGREFSVGILDTTPLPPIEIIPLKGWYDYKNKYQNGMTKEVTPADLTDEQTKKVQKAALAVHSCLHLGDYSRIDFILDKDSGDFYCLEANTLPGMTPTSLLPQEAAAIGITYAELCERIVRSAYKKEFKA